MEKYYSESTGGFYPADMREDYEAAGTWPADAVVVSAQAEAALRVPAPVPFAAIREAYLASVRATRELILNRLAGIGLAALFAGDATTGAAVQSARLALLAITDDPRVTAAADIDALKAAVLTAYREIVSVAPEALKKAILQGGA